MSPLYCTCPPPAPAGRTPVQRGLRPPEAHSAERKSFPGANGSLLESHWLVIVIYFLFKPFKVPNLSSHLFLPLAGLLAGLLYVWLGVCDVVHHTQNGDCTCTLTHVCHY
jgi:hypothetical protein